MKNLALIIILVCSQKIFAQSFTPIKSKNYTGIIIQNLSTQDLKTFLPSLSEIRILEENLKVENNNSHILPIKNAEFFRQYFGFYIGDKKFISVYFIPKKSITSEIEKGKYNRCENCISVNYDIEERQFYRTGICGE